MFASAYLTLTSIIQGVALAALVQRVEGTYASFDATSWIMTATTFLAILVIWHGYLVQVMGYVWTPTLIDSIVPFAFVAGEVFMTYFVAHDLRDWLLASGATFLVGVAAWVVGWRQARSGREENRAVFRGVPTAQRFRGLLPGALGLLGIAGWALYDVLGFSHSQVIGHRHAESACRLCRHISPILEPCGPPTGCVSRRAGTSDNAAIDPDGYTLRGGHRGRLSASLGHTL